MTWSATQYLAFEDERSRPPRDLLNALPCSDVRTAVDLGCGPGNSTELLAARYPAAAVSGIDSSPEMIAAARARLPALRFDVLDIAAWLSSTPDASRDAGVVESGADPARRAVADTRAPAVAEPAAAAPRGVDLLLANAVLQWLPDHATLFPALVRRLAPRGCLAVQMPDNLDEPAHRLMREVAARGSWGPKLAAAGRAALPGAAWYHGLLRRCGCQVDVWRTTYHHALAGGARAIVEWFAGSGLRPFLQPLDVEERAAYLADYERAVAAAYPAEPDGTVLLPFPRLFIMAVRDAVAHG